jgi:16S rRNA C967 or C1407 C5-methylase (RsmB/RsmF family)
VRFGLGCCIPFVRGRAWYALPTTASPPNPTHAPTSLHCNQQLDGEVVDPPRPLPWYPNKLAWHMNFSRGQLRKLSWLSDIHEFMKGANEAGAITRQEAVSMVPPMFMDVQPHHKVGA